MTTTYIITTKATGVKDSVFTCKEYDEANHILQRYLDKDNRVQVISFETRIRTNEGLPIESHIKYYYNFMR